LAHSNKTKNTLKKKRKAFSRFVTTFEQQVQLKAHKCNLDIAQEMAEEAKEIIENQSYKWVPLTDAYLDRKIAQGYDPRIMIKTREYTDAIDYGDKDGVVWVGFPEDKIHQGSNLPIRVLAKIHEFGTRTVPARPLWRPLLAKYIKLRPEFGRRYRKAIVTAVKKSK
jgi:hypothetical protein